MNQMEFLAWERTSRDIIDFKRIYVDISGDILAGLMLSEIIYWYLPDQRGNPNKLRVEHEGELWIACRRYEWWDRARLTPRQADRLIQVLEQLEIIEKRIFKFLGEPTTHIRILWDNFLGKLQSAVENPPSNPFSPEKEVPSHRAVRTTSPLALNPVTETTVSSLQTKEIATRSVAPLYGGFEEIPINPRAKSSQEIENKYVPLDQYPTVATQIMQILKRNNDQANLRLTPSQLKDLQKEVFIADRGKFPSPIDEQTKHPASWESFIDDIENMPHWIKAVEERHQRITVGFIIEHIRGYHWQGGWLEYRPEDEGAHAPVDMTVPAYNPIEEWKR